MKSVNIATQILLADAAITAIVGDAVYPIFPDQEARLPYIVVHLISEPEETMLSGASQIRDARVSIESCCADIPGLSGLGEKVIAAMRDKVELLIAGANVTTRKASTDEIDYSKQTGPTGGPPIIRRITDFYLFWRPA